MMEPKPKWNSEEPLELYKFNFICRVCLEHKATVSIYDDIENILHKLTYYQDDGLPSNLCSQCLNNLNIAYNFRNQCEESDKILKNVAYDVEVKAEVEPWNCNSLNDRTDNTLITNNILDSDKLCKEEYLSDDDWCGLDPDNEANTTKKSVVLNDHKKTKLSIKNIVKKRPPTKKSQSKRVSQIQNRQCIICFKKLFGSRKSFKRHVSGHAHTFTTVMTRVCILCAREITSTAQAFRRHIYKHKYRSEQINVANKATFPCEVCGKMFLTVHYVNRHAKNVHQKKFARSCPICNKVLSNLGSFKCHMRMHTGETKFECSVCKERFIYRNSMQDHMLKHTGQKPHRCRFCDSSFRLKRSKEEHERLHTGERPYVCPVCGMAYAQLGNMKSHFRHNHKEINYCDVAKRKPNN